MRSTLNWGCRAASSQPAARRHGPRFHPYRHWVLRHVRYVRACTISMCYRMHGVSATRCLHATRRCHKAVVWYGIWQKSVEDGWHQ